MGRLQCAPGCVDLEDSDEDPAGSARCWPGAFYVHAGSLCCWVLHDLTQELILLWSLVLDQRVLPVDGLLD